MKNIIIIPAGQFAKAFYNLLNENQYKLLAFGDNNKKMQNTVFNNIPILSIEDAIGCKPDTICIAVLDDERKESLKNQVIALGYTGNFIYLQELYQCLDIRLATLKRIVPLIENISGDIAELGVYKGDFAKYLNRFFPKRKLHLFDTFSGFDQRDLDIERHKQLSKGFFDDFSQTSVSYVLQKMKYPKQIIIHQGFFPETAKHLEHLEFALVSLDADLYQPLYEGLKYFYPRLKKGGMIILHDYNNPRFAGAKQAVTDYQKNFQPLYLVPLSDLHGTAVIIHI